LLSVARTEATRSKCSRRTRCPSYKGGGHHLSAGTSPGLGCVSSYDGHLVRRALGQRVRGFRAISACHRLGLPPTGPATDWARRRSVIDRTWRKTSVLHNTDRPTPSSRLESSLGHRSLNFSIFCENRKAMSHFSCVGFERSSPRTLSEWLPTASPPSAANDATPSPITRSQHHFWRLRSLDLHLRPRNHTTSLSEALQMILRSTPPDDQETPDPWRIELFQEMALA